MDLIETLINMRKRYCFQVCRSYWVYITHINNPHSFYVRPLEYNQYIASAQIPGDPVSKSDIKIGSVVIFKSKITKAFVRGKIIFIEGEDDQLKCDLHAVDVGCRQNGVPIQQLWKPYHEVNLPALAFHCQLANCVAKADNWNQSTIEAMSGYVQGKIVKIEIKSVLSEVFVVEVSVHSPDDLSTLLAITRHTHMGSVDDLDYHIPISSVPSSNFYSDRILKVKSVLHVRMLSGAFLDKFFASPIDEYNTYLVESERYTAYAIKARSLNMDQVVLNAPVGVFYHRTHKFERGIVREINSRKEMAKVELVDWGKMVTESIELMRYIPGEFLVNPPIGIYFGLHIRQYETTKLSEISNLSNYSYPGVEFSVTIEEVSEIYDNPNLVTVFGVKA